MCLKSLLYPEEGSGAKSCFHWHPSPSAEGFDDGIWPLAANSIPRLLGIYLSTQRHKCMAPWQPNSVVPVDSFCSWGKEVISCAGDQEIQLGRGFCQERVLAELQIIFLRSLSCAPSNTPWFSLVLVTLVPHCPFGPWCFHRTHFFTMNSNSK